MQHFEYRDGRFHAEDVDLARIAEAVGTPAYVYSSAALEETYRRFAAALAPLDPLICYAVKANSNLAVIGTFARLGAGADVVSVGEMARALAAGVPGERIVFAGVGKRGDEMAAALKAGILQFNVESEPELLALNEVALGLGLRATASLRVNPDIDAGTHPKITTGSRDNKFGVDIASAKRLFETARRFDMRVQPQLILLQKTLLNIEGLGRQLYPELDLWKTAQPVLRAWMRERTSPRALARSLRRQLPDALETLRLLPGLVRGAVRAAADGELQLQVRDAELARLRHALEARAQRRDAVFAAGVLWLSGLAWLVAGPRYPLAGLVAMAGAVVLFVGASGRIGERRDP